MKRHAFDPFSFVAGLLSVALALFFLGGDRTLPDLGMRWIWPVMTLTPGLLLVLYGIGRLARNRDQGEPSSVESPEPPEE